MKLNDIFKDSDYKLSQFKATEINTFEQNIYIKKTAKNELPYIKCLVRDKEIQLKPEEAIRQLYLMVLNQRYGYPFKRMEVEYSVSFGREKKKADIVIFDQDRPTVPYIIIELKKPKLKDGKEQLKSYCNATGAPIAVWTNGEQISYYQRKDPNYFEDITDIPNVNQTLADILNEKFTLEDLIKKDKLVNEKKSLKTLIEEMEDEVLANAGVDVFEEIFKLIFAKLYDEWLSGQGSNKTTRLLEFRNTGQTETALKNKIQNLFDQATEKWEGVFSEDTKITLTPSHLSVCISSLENVKLFNSNLDVVDEAFEYLINKSSKGEKGQFFTPRYVIDMCVKMLNPKEDEHMIDTAAGSAGFPVHTIFHVWKQILTDEGIAASHLFSLENKPYRCRQYVENKVFALDFDEKAVRVARTLNLIAGDGETNVLHLNTLDFERWDEWTKQEHWNDIYNNGFKRLKKLQKDKGNYQQFNFDVLMANPPFAGDIKESRLIQKYDLSVKSGGKRQTKMGRDILFIERNLDFLKPGGRMAIVLPQGRFNNSSDKYIRDYIAEKCRILAVIGLHGNTFKPHTGTKTSVLLVQKWDDQLCPKVEDYQIFFATQRKSGKDNSGEKIWRKTPLTPLTNGGNDRSPLTPLTKGGIGEDSPPCQGGVGGSFLTNGGIGEDSPPCQGELGGSFLTKGGIGEDSPPCQGGLGGSFLQDSHGHLIVEHDLFNHEGLTEDGIAEAFIEFAKKEGLSFFDCRGDQAIAPTFDNIKYQLLMDKLEAVELKLSVVLEDNITQRIDSEYFKKEYLQKNDKLKILPIYYLENIAEIKGGKRLPLDENFVEEGIPYIRAEDVKSGFVNYKSSPKISFELNQKLKQYQTFYDDVILTIVGNSIGDVGIVKFKLKKCNLTENCCKITKCLELSPNYLFAFLISRYGQIQIERETVGTAQPKLALERVKTFKIPQITKYFQLYIEFIINKSYFLLEKSEIIYQQSEELLLSELGLKDWQPTEDNIAEKSFSVSFLASGRLDAEYYQPKYDQLISKIITNKYLLLKDIVTIKKSIEPGSEAYLDSGIPFIRVSNLSKEGLSETDIYLDEKSLENIDTLKPKKDTILLSKDGSIGISYKVDSDLDIITSSAILHLRIKENIAILPDYLTLILNSIITKLQAERDAGGSIIQHWRISEIEQILIPVININLQEIISQKIQESFNLRQQSKQLLEIAKIGVEKAIETDENTATDWIKGELDKMGLKL